MMVRSLFFAIAAIMAVTCKSYGMEWSDTPGVRRNPGNLTTAKWIWHSGPVLREGEAFFRFAFDVPGDAADAFVRVAMVDGGEWYLNGKRQTGREAGRDAFTPGRNVFAAHVKNYEGAAGVLVFGEIRTNGGRILPLRSTRGFKTCDKIADGWEQAGFDDARWANAREIADASGEPYSVGHDYLADFATAEERAAVMDWRNAHPLTLPAGLEKEPEPVAKIVYEGNMPKIEVNGERLEPDFNSTGMSHDYAANVAAKTAALGWRINQVAISPSAYEKEAGVYDFSALDEMAHRVLTCNPASYLVLNINISIPQWTMAHPESWVGYGDGKAGDGKGNDDLSDRVIRPSAASPEYRMEMRRLVGSLCEYVKGRPWSRRVIAVRPCWGVYWEWHVYGFYHSPDVGPAMTAAFRRWKGGRYASENPPGPEERTGHGIALDTAKCAKVADFYECLQDTVVDLLTETAKEIKKGLPGRLVGAYYGYAVTAHPPEGANVMLDKVLSSPAVDFLSDPTAYTPGSRRAGGPYYHRTIPATFHRYGKLALIEDDMRHHHILEYAVKSICAATPRESRMVMRRNYLNRMFDGCGIQIFDPGGLSGGGTRPCTHDDPAVLEGLREAMEATRKAGEVQADSGNDMAVVYDWRQCLKMDNKAYRDKVFRRIVSQGPELMYTSGMVFDLISLDDYVSAGKPYARVVFANVFTPDGRMAEAARAKLLRDGAKAVRLVLPGSVRGGLGAGTEEIETPPRDARGWAGVFAGLGATPIAPPGNYVRRQCGLVLFHTAKRARQRLTMPEDGAYEELFSGHVHAEPSFDVETDGPVTLLYRKTK